MVCSVSQLAANIPAANSTTIIASTDKIKVKTVRNTHSARPDTARPASWIGPVEGAGGACVGGTGEREGLDLTRTVTGLGLGLGKRAVTLGHTKDHLLE